MGEEKKPFWRELLPHAAWRGIEEIIKRLLPVVGATVISIGVAVWEKLRHPPLDWYFIGGLFVMSSFVLVLLAYVARKNSPIRSAEIAGIVEEILVKKGLA